MTVSRSPTHEELEALKALHHPCVDAGGWTGRGYCM